MVLIVTVEIITVFVVPNFTIIGMVLPFILIPSLVGIVYIFFLAYRLNRLSVVKPKILTVGFFLYLISNIFRPVMQNILGENASYITVVELVDLAIFIVIFFGLYKKS
jgi:Na+/melibiose symporter-like transporter